MQSRPSLPRALLALAGLVGCTSAPPSIPSEATRPSASRQDAAAIHGMLAALDAAWNRHDIPGMRELLADDVQWIVTNGNSWRGKQQVHDAYLLLHHHLATGSPMSIVRTDHVELQMLDANVAQGMATLMFGDGTNGADQEGPGWHTRASFVMVRDGGAWKIAQFHQTLLDPRVQREDPIWGGAAGRSQGKESAGPARGPGAQ